MGGLEIKSNQKLLWQEKEMHIELRFNTIDFKFNDFGLIIKLLNDILK